jgi:hypothetical protein
VQRADDRGGRRQHERADERDEFQPPASA